MTTGLGEFRDGWRVVLASVIGIGLGLSPLPFFTIGVFAKPLATEFGWSIGQIMSALVVFMLGTVAMSPIIGFITDRVGPRRVVLTAIVLFSLSMMSFSLMNGSIQLYLLIWALVAITGAGTLPITWTRAVNAWFVEKRGLALGISMIGTGLFGTLAKQYAFFLIELVGWRWAYVGVGALPLLIAWPIAFGLFREPTDPKAVARLKKQGRPAVAIMQYGGMSFRQALTDWRFWLLACCFVPISFGVGGPLPNLETMLGSKGFDPQDAVTLASILGIAIVIGRLLGGYLIDRFWAPAVAATLLSIPAISMLMLSQAEFGFAHATVAIIILGIATGAEFDLVAYLVSRYFGLSHYAVIYGVIYAFFALGAGTGPAVFGAVFEAQGSYDSMFRFSAFLFVAGALPLLLLGRYRDFVAIRPDSVRDTENTSPQPDTVSRDPGRSNPGTDSVSRGVSQ